MVAENIRVLKKHSGLSNIKLAAKCGVSEGTINRAMSGKTASQIDSIESIAAAFGLHGWQLMIPGLDPNQPHVIYNISEEEKALYDRLRNALNA